MYVRKIIKAHNKNTSDYMTGIKEVEDYLKNNENYSLIC